MRSVLTLLGASLLLALVFSLIPGESQARAVQAPSIQNGSELLAAVNSLRASSGLPAYVASSTLMQIAQAQADYMAATGGKYGHSGPDGSRPIDRAVSAGYPAVFFSENWQAGSGLSPYGAVSAWQVDAPHLNTMLSTSLVDAGAGVSKSAGVIYYVLDAGAQGSSKGPENSLITGTTVAPGTPKPSPFMVPVTINTPGPDGLVYHEVAYGQSLWSIAIAYRTKIDVIQSLNNLYGLDIYPGQKLLILRGPTPISATVTTIAAATNVAALSPTAGQAAVSNLLMPTLPLPTQHSTPAAVPPEKGRMNLTAAAIIGAALIFAILGTWAGMRKPI
jgi:uncharacterized protein YkwD